MNLGEKITDQPLLENIPEGSSYLIEAGDGSGSKHIKHETVVSKIGEALRIGDMKDLEELEKTEVSEDEEELEKQGKQERITLTRAILKILRIATMVFGGTDGIKAGTAGIVPAPEPEDEGKVLGANGKWVEPSGGGDGGEGYSSGTPVGTIIAYMGTTAPDGYLACDGTVYNISEYPILAEHIKTQFGRYDYWGGDGKDTFAVKNLQGEFLRGAGENGHKGQGSGAAVGEHQDGTLIPKVYIAGNTLVGFSSRFIENTDSESDMSDFKTVGMTVNVSNQINASYTSRPTNTAVLYCIKYQ